MKAFYGLPKRVKFCKKTLISNQRPNSTVEFKNKINSKKKTIRFDKNSISDTWKYSLIKNKINYKNREINLLRLLDKHRGKHGKYDCIVPGSGGKDSCYAAHILKFKYGMNPLTVTWQPIMRTHYGNSNFKNWLKSGLFSNVQAARNEELMKLITKNSIINLFHPFQTFMLGQKNFPVKIADKYNIPLVFYGEHEGEHGNPIAENFNPLRNDKFFSYSKLNEIYLGGVKAAEYLKKYKFSFKDLEIFLPLNRKKLFQKKIEVHYLGYYLKWIPQECFYYAVENCGFKPRPFRTQGTYSKYNSIDDKIDDLHYYTTFIKFGIGRATYDVSQELRNKHLNISEGKKLIEKYDGEFPDRYFDEIMNYLNIKKNYFFKLRDKFRSPHLWKKIKGKWYLRHNVNKTGVGD
tara:strand:+ start:1043 stop:2257 length:1215 start_codon:yes stop_codon:yes gene_type:complete